MKVGEVIKDKKSKSQIKRNSRIREQKELIEFLRFCLESFISYGEGITEEQYNRLFFEIIQNAITKKYYNKALDENFLSQMTLSEEYFFKYSDFVEGQMLNIRIIDGEHHKASEITKEMRQDFTNMTKDFFDDVRKLRNFYQTIKSANEKKEN